MKFTDVPIPDLMKHLPLDRRGYPIPVGVLRDDEGRPHFQINDENVRQGNISKDLCPICGKKLFRARWFVGGNMSGFSNRGLYIDPPTHFECLEYALKVCPYLAAPNYGKPLGTKTLAGKTFKGGTLVATDPTQIPGRLEFFVAVKAVGQEYFLNDGAMHDGAMPRTFVRYTRHKIGTVREIRVWRWGEEVRDESVLRTFFTNTVTTLAADYGDMGRKDMWDAARDLLAAIKKEQTHIPLL